MSNSLTAALSGESVSSVASQGTTIEQARAIAEVQAMVVVAQRLPRNVPAAISQVRESCKVFSLASVAFFEYSRGTASVSGPSIRLATELARCWGNINYGVVELSRDDARGVSEMLAFAWDVQTNVRNSTTFIVPHRRDKKGGAVDLVDMRDIYENNANQAARRLREMILRALPSWLVEDAKALCQGTLEKGEGDMPLDKRIARAIETMANAGISVDRLAAKHGPSTGWTPVTLAQITVSLGSINRGEIQASEAYPTVAASIATQALASVSQNSPANEAADVKKTDHPGGEEKLTSGAPAAEAKPAPVPVSSETRSSLDNIRKEISGAVEAAVAKQEDPAMVEFTQAKIKMLAKVKNIDELDAMHMGMLREIGHLPQQLAAWNTARLERLKKIPPPKE